MRRLASTSTAALLTLSLVAPATASAGAQLFKCVESGRTVYQQQACPVTSQSEAASGSAQFASKSLTTPAAASEPAAKLAVRVKPASPSASSAPATPR